MPKEIKRILVVTVGAMFILLGLVGLALPFLQGVLFIIIGVLLLSIYVPTVRSWVDSHTEKHPKLKAIVKKIETAIERVIGRP